MFEKVKGCITLFERKDTISADNCMELLSSVFMDVIKQNGIKNVSGLQVANSEIFIPKMSSVLSALSALIHIQRQVYYFGGIRDGKAGISN